MFIKADKESLSKAPATIGVYVYWQGNKRIYIGKSVNIRARLKSHYEAGRSDEKERLLSQNSDKIEIIPAESEFMALVLESSLIKKHLPRYNRASRDDKSYAYITFDKKEEFPRVQIMRGKDITDKKIKIFGPFPSAKITESILREIRRVSPLVIHGSTQRPCFESKLGLCFPCPGLRHKMSPEKLLLVKKEYRKNLHLAEMTLKGNTGLVVKKLYEKLKNLSHSQNFEEAIILRNRILHFERFVSQKSGIEQEGLLLGHGNSGISSLENMLKKYFPKITSLSRIECYDISNTSQTFQTAAMVVSKNGFVDKSQYRKFRIKNPSSKSDFEALAEVMERRFNKEKHSDWEVPDLILVDGGKPQVRTVLTEIKKMKLEIPVVGIAKNPDRLIIGTNELLTLRPNLSHAGFNLVRLLRDEAHRFSKKYHTLLRDPLAKTKAADS